MATYALSNVVKLVEVDYDFQGMRDLLDNDIGWGPISQVVENYGFGEVIQGPKPKKQKKVVLEEHEYTALLKLKEKVLYLGRIVEEQIRFLGSKNEAFRGAADLFFTKQVMFLKVSK